MLVDYTTEILDVRLPRNGALRIRFGSSSASLIVENQVVILAEPQHLRQQIPMIGSGTAVEDDQSGRALLPVFRPVQRNFGGGCVTFLARRGDGFGHRGRGRR